MAATIVLFPLFAAVVFMFVNAVFWQNGRQVARRGGGPGVAVGRPVRVLVGARRGGRRRPDDRSAGLDDVSVIDHPWRRRHGRRVVSGQADGLLPGMSVTVTARSVTPSEGWRP